MNGLKTFQTKTLHHSYIVFDIESFYPSISLELFHKAINCDIPEKDISIIMKSRGTLLFNNKEPWLKKSGIEEFEVPMGCLDGAEVCELVGVYILHLLKTAMRKENVGLYHDDGLGILRNSLGPEIERKRKQIIQIFKSCGLNITVKTNLKTADFLDVSLDLVNNIYKPYRKPNGETVCINKHSNHPPNILKELPIAVNKQITHISCNQDIFDAAKSTYEQALRNSGFSEELKYKNKDGEEKTRNEEKRKRRWKIIWFIPPFSLSVKTNIGKLFFKILKKHFPKVNPLSRIFNKNSIKISYSCTRNIKSIISSHNKQILTPKNKQVGCNCRVKNSCLLDNKCLTSQLIYQDDVTNNLDNEDLQKQLLKNGIATTKVRLKMKMVKTVRNCRNMFGH